VGIDDQQRPRCAKGDFADDAHSGSLSLRHARVGVDWRPARHDRPLVGVPVSQGVTRELAFNLKANGGT
jgi:hypothetical protein